MWEERKIIQAAGLIINSAKPDNWLAEFTNYAGTPIWGLSC